MAVIALIEQCADVPGVNKGGISARLDDRPKPRSDLGWGDRQHESVPTNIDHERPTVRLAWRYRSTEARLSTRHAEGYGNDLLKPLPLAAVAGVAFEQRQRSPVPAWANRSVLRRHQPCRAIPPVLGKPRQREPSQRPNAKLPARIICCDP